MAVSNDRPRWAEMAAGLIAVLESRPGRPPSGRLRGEIEADAKALARCLDSIAPERSVDRDTAALWLVDEGYGPTARARLLHRWGQFLGWSGRRHDSPAAGALRVFTHDDLRALVAAARRPPLRYRGAWPTRDVVIVGLLAATGAHPGELLRLSATDIGEAGEVPLGFTPAIRRRVPVPPAVRDGASRYLAERHAAHACACRILVRMR